MSNPTQYLAAKIHLSEHIQSTNHIPSFAEAQSLLLSLHTPEIFDQYSKRIRKFLYNLNRGTSGRRYQIATTEIISPHPD